MNEISKATTKAVTEMHLSDVIEYLTRYCETLGPEAFANVFNDRLLSNMPAGWQEKFIQRLAEPSFVEALSTSDKSAYVVSRELAEKLEETLRAFLGREKT